MEKLKVYESSIPGNLNYVRSEVNNIIGFLQETWGTIEDCTLFELKVIINELLLNAVKHGNKEDNNKLVRIAAGIEKGDCAFIDIQDDGEGYDYECLIDKAERLCSESNILNLKETGRGLLIIKNLCDNIQFNEKGNRVIVEKKLVRPSS